MTINFPVYEKVLIDDYQMFPGTNCSGIAHEFIPGMHLVVGVNGLGKSTIVMMLYHGIVGPASVRNEDYGVPRPEVVPNRFLDRFSRRVADGAKSSRLSLAFSLGKQRFKVTRSLLDLSIEEWQLNEITQEIDNLTYMNALTSAMNVASFADVLTILNVVVFMFEERSLLTWTPNTQRNVLRALFMPSDEADALSERAQKVAQANSAYRNFLTIANREKRKLEKIARSTDRVKHCTCRISSAT